MANVWQPKAWAKGRGDVTYSPVHSTSGAFGDWEVHPQRVRYESDGCVELRANGEWVVHHASGAQHVFTSAIPGGGRDSACRLAYVANGCGPTRVVDLDDTEISWAPTTELDRMAIAAAHQAVAHTAQGAE